MLTCISVHFIATILNVHTPNAIVATGDRTMIQTPIGNGMILSNHFGQAHL